MSLVITKDCFPPADKCHNCERKYTRDVRKKPAAVKDYKRCANCHLLTYCDTDCQREHWYKVHKRHCKFLSGKTLVKNSEHNATSCIRCIEERESSPTELRSGNSAKTVCGIEEITNVMKKTLCQAFGFHAEGKEGHCSLQFPFELPFSLGEVSGQYVEKGSTGLDAMLAHTLKILKAMFIKAQKEDTKNYLYQLWNNIIRRRSELWYDIVVRGITPVSTNYNRSIIKHQSYDQVDILQTIYGASNLWWKSLKFTVDFIRRTDQNLDSNAYDSHRMEDPRFQKLKLLHDYRQSQLQIQAMVCEHKTWPKFMMWPRLINGSLAVLLPPGTRCQSCYAELCGEVAVTIDEVNFIHLPYLLSDVSDNGALMACCPFFKNPNCSKECIFKNVQARMCSDEDQWKELSKENELFAIESRECDFCLKASLSSHRCSACRSVQYCSADCLKKDLEFHKSVCATWAKDKSRRIQGKDKQKDHRKSKYNKQ